MAMRRPRERGNRRGLGIRRFRITGVEVGTMPQGDVCMGTNERSKVNPVADAFWWRAARCAIVY